MLYWKFSDVNPKQKTGRIQLFRAGKRDEELRVGLGVVEYDIHAGTVHVVHQWIESA